MSLDGKSCPSSLDGQRHLEPGPVLLSRPSKDGFARLDGRLGKIARLTPVFL